MKNILSYILLVLCNIIFAQSLPITTNNNLKITNPVHGSIQDSLLVWRGAGDKIVRFLPSSYFASKDYVNSRSVEPIRAFNQIGAGDTDEPILTFSPGNWDEGVREIGNTFFSQILQKYVFCYTGHVDPYNNSNGRIGIATSVDGKVWVKNITPITATGFEDPFIIELNGEFLLYSEKKTGSTHVGINLHRGVDLNSLTDIGVVYNNISQPWKSQDVSSPSPFLEGGVIYMYYEGRAAPGSGNANLGGATGICTSTDGVNFSDVGISPIVTSTEYPGEGLIQWSSHNVPDKIIKIKDTYYMALHAYNGVNFATCIMSSQSLTEGWHDLLGTWINNGIYNQEDGSASIDVYVENTDVVALYVNTERTAIYKGYFAVRNGSNNRYTVRNVTTYPVYPANREEYIDFKLTADRNFILKADSNTGSGVTKIIKNNSNYTLNITPDTGVLFDGVGTAITIASNEIITLKSTAVNNWTVFNRLFDVSKVLAYKADIPTATDLNTYIVTGVYLQTLNANATLLNNYPVAKAGKLEVVNSSSATGFTFQTYHVYGTDNEVYFRTRNGATWYAWKKIVTGTEVQNSLTASTVLAPSVTAVNTALALKLDSSSILSGSATLDFSSTAVGTSSELTMTVTGASDGDIVSLGVPSVSNNANSCFTARVSATNTVTVKFNNYSSGAIDPASGTFKVKVFK